MMSGCLYQYSDNLEEEEMAEKMTVAILGLGMKCYNKVVTEVANKI